MIRSVHHAPQWCGSLHMLGRCHIHRPGGERRLSVVKNLIHDSFDLHSTMKVSYASELQN